MILSGDTLRGELFGDERLQYTNAFLIEHGYDAENMTHREKEIAGQTLVWNMLKDRAIQLLKEGKNVAYDGVNNVPKYRALIILPVIGIAVIHALVFNTDIETCIIRDDPPHCQIYGRTCFLGRFRHHRYLRQKR